MTRDKSDLSRRKTKPMSVLVPNKPNTSVDYLKTYRSTSQVDEKLAIALRWSQSEPTLYIAWFHLGEAYEEVGDVSNALLAYTTACNLSVDDIGSLGRLADLHFQRGEFIEAFNGYQRILSKGTPPAWAFVGMGNVLERLGGKSDTLDHFLKAIELEPEHLATLASRVLDLFEVLPTESKIPYVPSILQLLDRLRGNIPAQGPDASRTARLQKLCNALQNTANLIYLPSQPKGAATKSQNDSSQQDGKDLPSLSSLFARLNICIEGIRHGHLKAKVSGWPGRSLAASLVIDGEIVGPISFDPGYSDEDQYNELHTSVEVPKKFLDAQPHLYFLQVETGSNHFQSEPIALRYPDYQLHFDGFSQGQVVGWCINTGTGNMPDLVACDASGKALEVRKGLSRPGVSKSNKNYSAHAGFEIQLNNSWPAISQLIFLRDPATEVVLAEICSGSRYNVLLDVAQQWAAAGNPSDYTKLSVATSTLASDAIDDQIFNFRLLPKIRCEEISSEVAIVIPVYKGFDETIECIESVLAAENKISSKIIIINDSSPNPLIVDYLQSLEQKRIPGLLVLHRRENGGFSEAVNAGILLAGNRDVVLLNSDTVVHSGWLDRLALAARSNTRIGTVTPLSNNAEICTVPYICKPLPINKPELALEIDQIAARVNAGKIQDIPVAHGFCMYITRACLDQNGLFDASIWGRGYGEEVDFCLKAAKMGWRHVMTGDTFIVHRGAVSFGDEKLQLIKESSKKISERYPFYDATISRYIAGDPAAHIRRSINLALLSTSLPSKRILHISHSKGGGTEQYVRDQCVFNEQAGFKPFVLRFNDCDLAEMAFKIRNTRLEGLFTTTHKESWNLDEIEQLKQDLLDLGFERLHLHAPFGMPLDFLYWLVDSFPTQITIHDYAWICPRVTLTQAGARYCQEPPVEQCDRCVQFNPPHPGLKNFLLAAGGNVGNYRQSFARILAKAEVVYAGGQDVVNRMRRQGLEANYKAVPHPHPEGSIFLRQVTIPHQPSNDGIVRVALVGGISDVKGFGQLIDCAEEAQRKRLPLEFIVFGVTADDGQFAHLSNVKILGPYKEEELEELMLIHRPQVAFFPIQCPETYSYTLTHALRFGLHPIVNDIGVPAERISKSGMGTLIPLDLSAKQICATILKSSGGH
jgi:GT2 family glycosyltransferase/tetratricopeptide (TPR) repeat protein/glycosyltransferase involved in cell wall biosynthesis